MISAFGGDKRDFGKTRFTFKDSSEKSEATEAKKSLLVHFHFFGFFNCFIDFVTSPGKCLYLRAYLIYRYNFFTVTTARHIGGFWPKKPTCFLSGKNLILLYMT